MLPNQRKTTHHILSFSSSLECILSCWIACFDLRSGAGACPNLPQRRFTARSTAGRSAEYQRFPLCAPARWGPLQQIRTNRAATGPGRSAAGRAALSWSASAQSRPARRGMRRHHRINSPGRRTTRTTTPTPHRNTPGVPARKAHHAPWERTITTSLPRKSEQTPAE